MNRCFSCGVEKDNAVLEPYSHPETDRICDGPVEPLFVVECVGRDRSARAAVVCHECFHRLDPDMWISEKCWEGLEPKTQFGSLPALRKDDRWNVEGYEAT